MGYVIGLYGPAKSGKDTVADYLLQKELWDIKVSFATNLKDMCQAIFNLTEDDVHTVAGKEKLFDEPKVFTQRNLGSVLFWMARTHSKYPLKKGSKKAISSLVGTELHTPREVMQFVGTDICRAVIPSYHLDMVIKIINESPDKNHIVTDIRFPDEGDMVIDQFNGKVFKIKRDSLQTPDTSISHLSETSMSTWSRLSGVIINNTQSLSKLHKEVDCIMKGNDLCHDQETQLLKNLKETSSHMEETETPRDMLTTKTIPSIDVG